MKNYYLALFTSVLFLALTGAQASESNAAYDKAQAMRGQAGAFVSAEASVADLRKAEDILKRALDFVRAEHIREMYPENRYLAARQWDIIRDLITVYSLKGDREQALSYAEELATSPDGLGWLAGSEQVLDVIGAEPEFIAITARERAWQRAHNADSFESAYSPNLSAEQKVAGLSLLWAEVKQGFVYFDQVPELDWDKTYLTYLPRVLASSSTEEYYRILTEFIALLKDGHTNVYYPEALQAKVYTRPPLRTTLIDGVVVVTEIHSPSLRNKGLELGDQLLRIDSVDVHEYANSRIKPYQSSSTPQDLDVRTYHYGLLAGDSEEPLNLSFKKASGHEFELTVARQGYEDIEVQTSIAFWLIDTSTLYFRLDNFGSRSVIEFFDQKIVPVLSNVDHLIFDLRNNGGGNSYYGYHILQKLTDKPFTGSLQLIRNTGSYKRARNVSNVHWQAINDQAYQSRDTETFKGRVTVLTSAKTFSAAEDFLVAFRQVDRGEIIGQTSAGSSGQPLSFALPGGGSARICVKRDKLDVSTDWVGVGIQPDIAVSPTVADIVYQRDPVLAAALRQK